MFTGFTGEAIDFLWGIRLNNRRDWFEEHKSVYRQSLYLPMTELAQEIGRYVQEKRQQYDFIWKTTRIHRDARRLYGRDFYKESLWFLVETPCEAWTACPTFWFELLSDGWTYGLGYYNVKPLTMAKFRARILHNPEPVQNLMADLYAQNEFVLEAEYYKRPRQDTQSVPEILRDWFKIKTFSFCHTGPIEELLFSQELVTRIEAGIAYLLPWYDYLHTLDADPMPAHS